MALMPEGQAILYGGGATLNLASSWAVAPFVHLGAGGLSKIPNEEAFLLKEGTFWHARVGGGLLVSLRWRILLRLEAMNVSVFDADHYENDQSYTGGLGVYF
jgi:hypothetical protein